MLAIGPEQTVGVSANALGQTADATAVAVDRPRFSEVIEELRHTQRTEAAQLHQVLEDLAGGTPLTASDAWTVQVLVSGQALRVELAARLVDAVSQGSRQLLQQGG